MRYALNTVEVHGYLTHRLEGAGAIGISATGYTSKQVPLVVQAALVSLGGSGALTRAHAPTGTADITLAATGAIKRANRVQTAPASITLTARHAIANPMPVPTMFYPARRANVITVEAQDNLIVVPKPDRTIVVAPRGSSITVAP